MPGQDDRPSDAEVRALFDSLVLDPVLGELRGLEPLLDDRDPKDLTDPRLRRPHDDELVLLVRAELEDHHERVWRELELTSDLTLDLVHDVLQAAFGWEDRHLYRFSLAGGGFDLRSEWFLCPYDAAEGDDTGTPVEEVHLGEVLQERGDVLHYIYDYGDGWQVRLTVHREERLDDDDPTSLHARCIAGEGSAPPEDSRGWPADKPHPHQVPFDLASVDEAVVRAVAQHDLEHLDERLHDVVRRLARSALGEELTVMALALQQVPEPTPEELEAAVGPVRWLLDRAIDDGPLPLTPSGYLKPDLVAGLAERLPTMRDWPGAIRREVDARPAHAFREALQRVGLLRKVHGRLEATAAGLQASHDTDFLVRHLGSRLIGTGSDFQVQVRLLLATCFAAGVVDGETDLAAECARALGWAHEDGTDVHYGDVAPERWRLWTLLAGLDPTHRPLTHRRALGPVARTIALRAVTRR